MMGCTGDREAGWQLRRVGAATVAASVGVVAAGQWLGRTAGSTARWVDRLLFPANWPSATELHPELQRPLRVGDLIPDGPPDTAWFVVEHVEPLRLLVLHATTHLPASWRTRLGASIDWAPRNPNRQRSQPWLAVPTDRDSSPTGQVARPVGGRPIWDLGGLLGSTLWGLWVLALGVAVLRSPLRRPAATAVPVPGDTRSYPS